MVETVELKAYNVPFGSKWYGFKKGNLSVRDVSVWLVDGTVNSADATTSSKHSEARINLLHGTVSAIPGRILFNL